MEKSRESTTHTGANTNITSLATNLYTLAQRGLVFVQEHTVPEHNKKAIMGKTAALNRYATLGPIIPPEAAAG